MAFATHVLAAFEGREILRRPDMCNVDTVDTVAWYAQESVRLEVEPWRCGKRVEIPEGATAAWVVADEGGTNWIVRYDGAPVSNRCAFVLGAGEGNLPSGHDYTGYVSLLSGTNILGVLDRHEVAVLGQAADGGSEISPEGGAWGSLLQRMAEAEADIHGIAGDLATNALEIAELEAATNSLDLAVSALEGAVANRLPAEPDIDSDEDSYIVGNRVEFRGDVVIHSEEFGGHVYWQGLDDRLGALEGATNALDLAVEALDGATNALGARIDSLYGECAGGFRWPDYFSVAGYETGVIPGTVTNAAVATQTVHNVIVETVESERLKGWRIDTEVIRQSDWDAGGVVWTPIGGERWQPPTIDPEDLVVDGNFVTFSNEAEAPDWNHAWARMVGTLGDYSVEVALDWDASKQSASSTTRRFGGPALGSLLAASWSNVLGAASNGYAASPRKSVELRTWPQGYGGRTNHVAAGWNANFWGYGLGDFSCVSYHTDGPPAKPGEGAAYGVYMPITMVTPRHGIVANHWKPIAGSNVYWVTRSGGIATNKVVSYKNVRGDLTVARLDHAFSTNDIAPAKLLGSGWHSYLYGVTNWVSGLFGVPVIGFDCAERGYVMNWRPGALYKGKTGGDHDDGSFYLDTEQGHVFPYFRREAVGGDSGSPVFWPIDGETVLLGCFHIAIAGPLPEKSEVDAAIAAWGDAERCEEYNLGDGGWANPDIPGAPGQ